MQTRACVTSIGSPSWFQTETFSTLTCNQLPRPPYLKHTEPWHHVSFRTELWILWTIKLTPLLSIYLSIHPSNYLPFWSFSLSFYLLIYHTTVLSFVLSIVLSIILFIVSSKMLYIILSVIFSFSISFYLSFPIILSICQSNYLQFYPYLYLQYLMYPFIY